MRIAFRTLGPLEVEIDGTPVRLGGPKQRAVLALLLLEPGRLVHTDSLLDGVWADGGSTRALQVYVSELRRALRDPGRIVGESSGYRLVATGDEVEHVWFERLVREGRALIAQGEVVNGVARLREALGRWRGRPFAGGPMPVAVEAEAGRLAEARLGALEATIEAELGLGRHAELVPELEALVAAEPLREQTRRQLMLALYRSGRQADALAVYHEGRRRLVDELGIEPGPELQATQLAILRQDPSLAVEAPEVVRRRRLPAPTTTLIGRRREVDDVVGLLSGPARLVTLTGPGGTGKTRIALRAAHLLAGRLPGGATFVGLGALRDPSLVPAAVATAIGAADAGDPLTAAADRLGGDPSLLLLDNFEQVDEAAPGLTRLLTAAPGLRLLVTSRHRLRLYGEHEYAIAPLEIDAEAVPLFVARASAAGRDVQPDEPDVRAVCVRLDGLPLAIELAAARIREFSPSQMVRSLSRLAIASDGPRDVPNRQRTMEGAIGWSHGLLPAPLRARLAALSVFAGGFSGDAAGAAAGATAPELEELAARSLLRCAAGRWEMLETVREFAAARLEEIGTGDDVRRAHAAWYLALAERLDGSLRTGGSPAAALDELEIEHDNLRAATEWAFVAEPVTALRIAVALGYFGEWRGHSREVRGVLERALELAGGAPSGVRIKALLRIGIFAQTHGDYPAALAAHEAALDIARDTGDDQLAGKALRNLATIAKDRGDYRRAEELLEEARAMSEALGDTLGVLSSLINLSDVALAGGELIRAHDQASAAASIARQLDHQLDLAVSLLNLALARLRQGREGSAAVAYDEALELCMRNGYTEGAVYALLGTAVLLEHRDPAEAARQIGAVDAELRRIGTILETTERPLRDDLVERLRAALGADVAERLIQEGAERPLEMAVVAAREGLLAGDRSGRRG